MTDEPAHDRQVPHPNGAAEGAFILGLLSLVGGLTTIPGLVMGAIALRRAKRLGGVGKGRAITGMVLCCVGVLLLLWGIQAVRKVREAASRMTVVCHLKCIGLSMHSYSDQQGTFPSPFARDTDVPFIPVSESELSMKLSWRVSIAPFLESSDLSRMNVNQPWDSPTNRPFASHVVGTFTDPDTRDDPNTRYRVFYGPGTAFPLDRQMKLTHITDGASNTIFVVESGQMVTWTRFAEMKFAPNTPPDPTTMGRPNQTTFQATMANGSVRTFRKTLNPQVFKAAITPNGGEVIDLDN